MIVGRVSKYFGLTSELFSGLLLNSKSTGGAATAVISVSSSTGSIHAMVLMSGGVFEPEQKENVYLKVRFESFHNGERRIIEEQLKVAKVDHSAAAGGGITSIDFKTVFDPLEMAALGHGQLLVTVTPGRSEDHAVSGYLAPKFSCDLFDCVLSPLAVDTNDEDSISPLDSPTRGIAWLLMRKDGDIQYHVRIDDAPTRITSIQVDFLDTADDFPIKSNRAFFTFIC